MYREIIINFGKRETRVAILEDGQVVELMTERNANQRMVGDIFKGTVSAIKPGIQAAFIDIGLEKSGFLAVTEASQLYLEEEDEDDDEDAPSRHDRRPIQEMLKKNQEVLVQVLKEPIGTKGPRLTTEISLAGRFVVLMPGTNHVAISRKVKDRDERGRLKKMARQLKPDGMGLIVRTVSNKVEVSDIQADIDALVKQWQRIMQESDKVDAPARIHKEMSVTSSLIRDLFSEQIDSLVVDSRDEYERIISYVKNVSPALVERIHVYTEKIALFDAFEVEKEIRKVMERKVWLKSGGYIVIDHTEALVAIDVNTGRYVGKDSFEDTIFKTNSQAAREIARQLRLRDIGGIIVIDFIDMADQKNRDGVLNEFKQLLKRDRSKTKVHEVSRLGLVEMTRQRTRPSIRHTYYETCPTCQGSGQILSKESLAMQIERWVNRAGVSSHVRRIKILANPNIAQFIVEENKSRLTDLQKKHSIEVQIEEDATVALDEFQVYSLDTNEEITEEFFA